MADLFDATEFEPKVLPGRVGTGASTQPTPYAPTEEQKSEPLNRLEKKRTFRGSLYFVFLFGLAPLAYDTIQGKGESTITRLEKAIDDLAPEPRSRARRVLEDAKEGRASVSDVLEFLPRKKLKDAWLPRDSDLHYYLGGVVAIGYMFLLGLCMPRGFTRLPLMLIVAAFTGTFGMTILMVVQLLALSGAGWLLAGPFGIIIWLVGISYRMALNPDSPFLPCLLGHTFGVGLCEEIVKALPVFIIFMGRKRLRWHECCALGMASGVGFGIAEGIHFAGEIYNGLCPMDIYFVRFLSCVTLHAVLCGSAALLLHRFQKLTQVRLTLWDGFCRMFILVSIPMVLHGLYDTLLEKEINGLALTVALFCFGWLTLMIETARDKEGDILVEVKNDLATETPLHQQSPEPPSPPPYQPPALMPAGLE